MRHEYTFSSGWHMNLYVSSWHGDGSIDFSYRMLNANVKVDAGGGELKVKMHDGNEELVLPVYEYGCESFVLVRSIDGPLAGLYERWCDQRQLKNKEQEAFFLEKIQFLVRTHLRAKLRPVA